MKIFLLKKMQLTSETKTQKYIIHLPAEVFRKKKTRLFLTALLKRKKQDTLLMKTALIKEKTCVIQLIE